MLHCQNRFVSGPAMISSSLQVPANAAAPLLTDRRQDYRMTRRSILGATASLICAPAIVQATSLMPVRRLPLHILNPMGEFYRDCFYHSLDSDLKAGRSMSTVIDGKIVSVVKTRRMVAYARAQGWLSPETDCVSGLRLVSRRFAGERPAGPIQQDRYRGDVACVVSSRRA
jgi:hypothetical protein